MLKYVVATAVLISAIGANGAFAEPHKDDCADCAVSKRYDSEEVIKRIRSIDKSRAVNPTPAAAARRYGDDREPAVRYTERRTSPRRDECADCAPRRKYDTQEVVKKVHNVDRSRVINTTTVIPAGRRVKETNHLIVHQNETRETGVVQHNHTIIEREIRYVRRIPVRTTVVFVTHHYREVERPDSISVPVRPVYFRDCGPRRGYGRHGSCGRVLRVRG